MVGRRKLNDCSPMTEPDSPLAAIPALLWDPMIQSKVEPDSLYAMTTPRTVDRSLQPTTPFYSYATSQGSDNTGSSSYGDHHGDHYKRRRMLQFTGINTGGFTQDSPPPYETVVASPTNTYSSYSSYSSSYGGSPLSSVYSGDDYLLHPFGSPTMPTSSWFSGSDPTTSSVLPSAQHPVEKWRSLQSVDKNQSYNAPMQMKTPVIPPGGSYAASAFGDICAPQPWKLPPPPPTPQSSLSHHHHQQQLSPFQSPYQQPFLPSGRPLPRQLQPKLEDGSLLQSPLTPFSKPPTPGRFKSSSSSPSSSGPSRFKTKPLIPTTLLFAMLKPSAAQGDVTLNDINKILLSPPPTPTPNDRPFPVDERRPPTPPGTGLSGKSVVACTKIHTAGAGTITIMRTKG